MFPTLFEETHSEEQLKKDKHEHKVIPRKSIINLIISSTFSLEYEDDYEYEFIALSTRFRLAGRKFLKCVCSELCPRTRGRPRTPI